MFNFCNNQHQEYQNDYINYILNSKNQKLKEKKCCYNSDIYKLFLFKSRQNSKEKILIVPSFFNSPEILLFNEEESYIDYLRLFGDVYLIQWQEVQANLALVDYVKELSNIMSAFPEIPHLVGHCIGGNLALFSEIINPCAKSLTLLTTPWDYSHFKQAVFVSELLQMRESIKNLTKLPKIYLQIMFFMLMPNQYKDKLHKYFTLDSALAKQKYLRIEEWLQSGIDLPYSLYNEILDQLILKNSLLNKSLYINNKQILLDKIKIPTCIIVAKNDQIVPVKSMMILQKEIEKCTMIEIEGGHISYLVNNDLNFKKQYRNWLEKL